MNLALFLTLPISEDPLLNCSGVAAASRAWSSLAFTDTEVIKAVKVHVNASTSFQIHIYSSLRSKEETHQRFKTC